MDAEIARLTVQLKRARLCPPELLNHVQETLRVRFPEDYATFMRESDGAAGWVGEAYVHLWSLEEILEAQERLEVDEFLPEACPIGSDGGGEAYALDRRTTPATFLEVPFIPLDIREARPCGRNFVEFLQYLHAKFPMDQGEVPEIAPE